MYIFPLRKIWQQNIWQQNIWQQNIWQQNIWQQNIWQQNIWQQNIWLQSIWLQNMWLHFRPINYAPPDHSNVSAAAAVVEESDKKFSFCIACLPLVFSFFLFSFFLSLVILLFLYKELTRINANRWSSPRKGPRCIILSHSDGEMEKNILKLEKDNHLGQIPLKNWFWNKKFWTSNYEWNSNEIKIQNCLPSR